VTPDLLFKLACPSCRQPLVIVGDESGESVRNGSLRCTSCGQSYPVRDGIPRFPAAADTTSDGGDAEKVRRTRRAYNFTWTQFGAAEIEKRWEKDSYQYLAMVPDDIFVGAGKTGLDAGCGGGADLLRFWERGIRVIGFDLSAGVDSLARTAGVPPHGDLVQGDLHLLPFKPGSFDFIYSFGVLHHLPDPRRGFAALADALKPGAPLVTYLYESVDARSGFARGVLRAVAAVRRVTAGMTPHVLHALCWTAVPFVWAAFALPARAVSVVSPRAAAALPFGHTARWPVLAADLYDRFAPPVEFRFTEQQVRDLYAACGLERVEVRRYKGWVSWGFRPEA
jgi:SAM-dependent methyltransferase/uncharacterized protein YbaR (Trm112 family)